MGPGGGNDGHSDVPGEIRQVSCDIRNSVNKMLVTGTLFPKKLEALLIGMIVDYELEEVLSEAVGCSGLDWLIEIN
ncbi:hypothetical protein M5K25_014895 [Dendrobium thyrsiflorum]|uniref:Uncharacterized protein n=1 Tax=Dendrobium thyrsiflorum TaxID=117978 RepID=A0ABD0UNU6_DENTH